MWSSAYDGSPDCSNIVGTSCIWSSLSPTFVRSRLSKFGQMLAWARSATKYSTGERWTESGATSSELDQSSRRHIGIASAPSASMPKAGAAFRTLSCSGFALVFTASAAVAPAKPAPQDLFGTDS